MKKLELLSLSAVLLFFVACGILDDDEVVAPLDTTTTTTTVLVTTTITSVPETTTTTEIIYDGCIPEDNQNINFEDLKNVQNFLNRYGFDAGTEDGVSGSQTREAIKRFQAYVGINVDGDLGPTTYGKMRNYTGCESRVNDYESTTTTTTTIVEEENTDTTTTTTVPVTTTTTVIAATYDYGFQGMISPENGNFQDIISNQNENNSFCSGIAPTYLSLIHI